MPRPLGDRTAWTFGYYPTKNVLKELRIAPRFYTSRFAAEEASDRWAATNDCEVTPPLRVKVEIPKGVKR